YYLYCNQELQILLAFRRCGSLKNRGAHGHAPRVSFRGNLSFFQVYPPTLLSIFPPLFNKIARALDLRLTFSGSGRRTATTVRAPCSGLATGVFTRDISCPMAPRTRPRWSNPRIT